MAMAATNDVYAQYERILFQAVYRALKKWGGTFEEYKSDANDIFMYAAGRWTEEKGKFSTYLTFLLSKLMVERVRSELKRKKRIPIEDTDVIPDTSVSQKIFELPLSLSDDARTVANLVLDMPNDIKLSLVQLDKLPQSFEEECKNVKSIRKCLVEYLEDLGWSIGRMDKTFREIRNSL